MTGNVAVVGNCQVWGLTACLQQRRPDWTVEPIFVGAVKTIEQAATIADRIRGYDFVFSQPLLKARYGRLTTFILSEEVKQLKLFPAVVFNGFHPDAIVLPVKGDKIYSPLGSLHSRIALASFICGIRVQRAADLFNAYIYSKLGYFSEFERAVEFQVRLGEQAAFDLRSWITDWRANGVFMHQPLHPKIAVAGALATMLCNSIGVDAISPEVEPADPLANEACWPIYPELARSLKVASSLEFKRKDGEIMDLDSFLFESYRSYRSVNTSKIDDEGVLAAIRVLRAEVI